MTGIGLKGVLRQIAFLTCVIAPVMASASEDEGRLSVARVAPGLYAVTGAGGTIALSVGTDGVLVVDDQVDGVSSELNGIISKLSSGPVRWVINTHWHHDHTGGNEQLAGRGAQIVSHTNVRPRLMKRQTMLPPMTGGTAPALPPRAWPVVTFSEEMTFYFNGDTIRVFHVPAAHTDGDAIVYFRKADVIHAGDVFFNGRYPNIDNGAGGTLSGMISALKRIERIAGPETQIIAGHGPIGRRDDVRAASAMLEVVRERVACLVARGRTEDEAVDRAPLRDIEADWAWFIDSERMVRHAWLSLTRDGAPDPDTFCKTPREEPAR